MIDFVMHNLGVAKKKRSTFSHSLINYALVIVFDSARILNDFKSERTKA